MAKRTVMRSSKGKKLYVKRGAGSRFKDIQSFKRAHAADLRKVSKDEKKERLADAINGFALGLPWSRPFDTRAWNVAWNKMWAKILKLDLF